MTVTNPGPALPAPVSGAALYGQGISFPPRVGPDGAIVWSTGELNVRECICTILRTRPGERVELAGLRLRAGPLPLRAEQRGHAAADHR